METFLDERVMAVLARIQHPTLVVEARVSVALRSRGNGVLEVGGAVVVATGVAAPHAPSDVKKKKTVFFRSSFFVEKNCFLSFFFF